MEEYRILDTAQGPVAFVGTECGVRQIFLPGPTRAQLESRIAERCPGAVENPGLLPDLADALTRYFAGEPVEFHTRIDWRGYSNFEVDVWRACAKVPYGRTASYKALADELGCPGAARAVGVAMSRNPVAPVVPCHRILKSDGTLGGYSGPGGLRQKQSLLDMEAAASGALLVKA